MLKVLRQAWWSFQVHEGSLLSGAVAFYALLALAPLGVLGVVVMGWVLGAKRAQLMISHQLRDVLDPSSADLLQDAIRRGSTLEGGVATLISVGFLLYASTRLFWMLRGALNHAWNIRSTVPPGFRGQRRQVLQRRLVAFGMIGILGIAFVVAALLKAGVTTANLYFGGVPLLWRGLDVATSIALFTVLIALIYRWLPDATIDWRDAMVGAIVTAALNTLGTVLIGHYLARISPHSMYGAAGSLIVLLLWVYYSTQIFLFGAELTAAYAELRGGGVRPLDYAHVIAPAERATIVPGDFEPPHVLEEQALAELEAERSSRPSDAPSRDEQDLAEIETEQTSRPSDPV